MMENRIVMCSRGIIGFSVLAIVGCGGAESGQDESNGEMGGATSMEMGDDAPDEPPIDQDDPDPEKIDSKPEPEPEPEPEATAETCGPDASLNADGTLTPYPDIEVSLSEGYSLVSLNLSSVDDGDERGPLLSLFAELRNDSSEERCFFLPNVYLGFHEIVTLVEGEQYYRDYGSFLATTTTECIQPGDTGIMRGVARGITTADLESAIYLDIDPDPSNYPSDVYLYAVPPTITSSEVVESDEGYVLTGEISYAETVFNQAVRVYPRDARGLIVDEILAFPGSLGTHPAGSSHAFETEPTDCRFVEYEVTQTWILED